MEKGSLRGSTFQLSTAALGSGVLSLPYILFVNGFILGTVLIIIGAIAAALSLRMLVSCSEKVRSNSYSDLVRKVMGKKLDNLLLVLLFFGISGSSISYQIIITQMI